MLGGRRSTNVSIAWARLSLTPDKAAAALARGPAGLWARGGPTASDCERLLAAGLPTDDDAAALACYSGPASDLQPTDARLLALLVAAGGRPGSAAGFRSAAACLREQVGLVVLAADAESLTEASLRACRTRQAAAAQARRSAAVHGVLALVLAVGNVAQRGVEGLRSAGLAVSAFDLSTALDGLKTRGFEGKATALDIVRAAWLKSAPAGDRKAALSLAAALGRAAEADLAASTDAVRRLEEGQRALVAEVVKCVAAPPDALTSAAARVAEAAGQVRSALAATASAEAGCSAYFGLDGDVTAIYSGLASLLESCCKP